jgi:hypothetical protein
MLQPSPRRGEGAKGGRGFKSSTLRCFAVKRLCRGEGVPNRGPKGRSGWYPTFCRELVRPFSLGYFSFTPGILPSALRAGFAVRTHSCACVGQQKKSDSSDGSRDRNARCVSGTLAITRQSSEQALDDQLRCCKAGASRFRGRTNKGALPRVPLTPTLALEGRGS